MNATQSANPTNEVGERGFSQRDRVGKWPRLGRRTVKTGVDREHWNRVSSVMVSMLASDVVGVTGGGRLDNKMVRGEDGYRRKRRGKGD